MVNKSAKERAQAFKHDGFYDDRGKLYSRSCNCVVDHIRKSVIVEHQQSVKQMKRKAEFDASSLQASTKQQRIIISMFKSNTVTRQERVEVCHDWVNMCISAYIPLSCSDHHAVRNFILTRVRNGGAIPGGHKLQESYLKDLYQIERGKLKALLKNEYVAVIFDQMSDTEGRFVFNILLSPTKLNENGNVIAYLADTVMLQKVDNVSVSQAVINALASYGIDFNNISVFDTDNAAYYLKAVQNLRAVCLNAVHITCLAHVMNLVGHAFKSPFSLVMSFVTYFSRIYSMLGQEKDDICVILDLKWKKTLLLPTQQVRKSQ